MIFRVGRANCFFKRVFCESCSDFYSTEVVPADWAPTTTAKEETASSNKVSVYPNPFNSYLKIDGLDAHNYFSLLDAIGRPVYIGEDIKNQYFGHLPKGLYFLNIRGDDREETLLLTKH